VALSPLGLPIRRGAVAYSPPGGPVWLDAKDLFALYGWMLESWRGVGAYPEAGWRESQRPGRDGSDLFDYRIGTRPIILPGYITAADPATLRTNWRKLLGLLRRTQPHVLKFVDDTTIALDVYVQLADPEAISPVLIATGKVAQRADLSLRAAEPYWYDVSESAVIGIGATPVDLPQGTAPTDLLIKLPGPWTNPAVTLWDWDDLEIATLSFPGESGGGSDYLFIDSALCRAYRNTTGIADPNAGTDLTAVYEGGWFRIEPEYSDYDAEAWTKLSSASGTAQATYRKRWVR